MSAERIVSIGTNSMVYHKPGCRYVSRIKKIHKKKHARAFHHAKRFKEELDELEKMYEKEDNNE